MEGPVADARTEEPPSRHKEAGARALEEHRLAPDGAVSPGRGESPPVAPGSLAEEDARQDTRGRRQRVHPAIAFLSAVVVIVGVLVALVVMNRKDPLLDSPTALVPGGAGLPAVEEGEEDERERFLKDGWKSATTRTLAGFLSAQTLDEKAGFVIGGERKLAEMDEFYGAVGQLDEPGIPVESFSHFDLDIVDRRRGLFLMRFERPPQLKMTEFFRPVVPLEVQHELQKPGPLLSAFASRERFAMEPLRIMAFFKEGENGLLLDWDVYTQTKYRTFKHFIREPLPGREGVFRVMVRESAPTNGAEEENNGARLFRLSDPAFYRDQVTLAVRSDELPGKILSELAWVDLADRRVENRYATVRLSWTEGAESELHLKEVICWEFLGLGGVAGNADPIGETVAGTEQGGGADQPEADPQVPGEAGSHFEAVSIREGESGPSTGEEAAESAGGVKSAQEPSETSQGAVTP